MWPHCTVNFLRQCADILLYENLTSPLLVVQFSNKNICPLGGSAVEDDENVASAEDAGTASRNEAESRTTQETE